MSVVRTRVVNAQDDGAHGQVTGLLLRRVDCRFEQQDAAEAGLEPISLGRLRRWQYLVVQLYCLRYCRLAIDLTR